MSKYEIVFEANGEAVKSYIKRLINQIWKLIPMRENNENWEYQLDLVLIELVGFQKIFEQIDILTSIVKLEGLKNQDMPFRQYRSEIFSIIDALGGI